MKFVFSSGIFTTKTGLPLHSTVIISPGSNFETSTLTGAPAASALALGLKALTNGIAVKNAPIIPRNEVVYVRNFLLPGLGGLLGCIFYLLLN